MTQLAKKVFHSLLTIAMILTPLQTVSVAAEETESPSSQMGKQAEESKNRYLNNYPYYWSSTVSSYLYDNGKGLTRVEHISDHVRIEDYDKDFNLINVKNIPDELHYFGGFYHAPDANYLVFGEDNTAHSDASEVLRVVKYTPGWSKEDSASAYGSNTETPFDAGSCRMAMSGPILHIETCHLMYGGHQANWRLVLNTDSMEFTDNHGEIFNLSTGYVSHSFNQYVLVDGEDLVTLDHEEKNPGPGSAALVVYKGKAGQEMLYDSSAYDYNHIESHRIFNYEPCRPDDHPNYTGGEIGGLAKTAAGYIAVHSFKGENSQEPATSGQSGYNVYATYMDKESGQSVTTKINKDGQGGNPVIVETGENDGYIFWNGIDPEHNSITDDLYVVSYRNNTYSQPEKLKGELSDCRPVVKGGKIYWYATANNLPVFYEFDQGKLSLHDLNPYYEIKTEENKHARLLFDQTSAKKNQTVRFKVECDEGYEITGVPVVTDSGKSTYCYQIKEGEYEYTGAGEPVTIKVNLNFTIPVTLTKQVDYSKGDLTLSSLRPEPKDEVILTPVPRAGFDCSEIKAEDKQGKALDVKDNQDGTFTLLMPESISAYPISVTPVFVPGDGTIKHSYKTYKDIDIFGWYFKGVKYVIDNGIMSGYDLSRFAPSDTTNRAMIVTILHRLEGRPEAGLPQYRDVANNSYYAKAAAWAQSSGIMTGYVDGRFGPNDPISREQMATVLYRYAKYKQKDTTTPEYYYGWFTDLSSISPFARDAMRWAVNKKIITGTSTVTLSPGGNATRAQVATILERYSHLE